MEPDYSHYVIGSIAVGLGIVFSISRDVAAGRMSKGWAPVITRVSGNFIIGWLIFWTARESQYSIELAGGFAAIGAAMGINLIAIVAYVIIISIETKAKIVLPERAKDFIEDLSK